MERDVALTAWRQASGSDLTRFQAQYNTNQAIIDFITKAPIDLTERE